MDWNSLAVGPCILISQANARCYNVPSYGYLVVGLGMIQTSSSPSSSMSGRRRLLSSLLMTNETQEAEAANWSGWETTASPCKDLALLGMDNLSSVTDREAWKRCLRWRSIGRHVLQSLNVSYYAMQDHDDTLFLSMADFARVVVMKRKGDILMALGTNAPQIAHLMMEQSGFLSTLKGIWKTFSRSMLAKVWISSSASKAFLQKNLTLIQSIVAGVEKHEEALLLSGLKGEAFFHLPSAQTDNDTFILHDSNNITNRRRNLLQTNNDDQFIKTYSAWVAATKGFSNIQIGQTSLTDTWLQGPLMWPPRFDHLDGGECKAADEAVSAGLQVANMLRRYYTSEEYLNAVTKLPTWDVASNAPKVYMMPDKLKNDSLFVQATPRPANDRKDLPAATFYYVLDSWIGPALGNAVLDNFTLAVASFFNLDATSADTGDSFTAGTMFKNSFVCDFEAVTFCRKENMPSRYSSLSPFSFPLHHFLSGLT